MTKGHKTEEMKTKTIRKRDRRDEGEGKDGKKIYNTRRLYREQNYCSFSEAGGKQISDGGTVSFVNLPVRSSFCLKL